MPDKCDMRWFKQTFHEKIEQAVAGTPFTLDFLTALACQETGEVWPILRKSDLPVERILELCVGDTIDAPNRSAFPKTKDKLVAVPNGPAMFTIARQALLDMAEFIDSYKGAASKPDKFCHGYGIFQFDLQFFIGSQGDPDYFLQKKYAKFDDCLQKALGELQSARNKIGLQSKPVLTDLELCHVAIAYNTGHFDPAKGLKQGYRPPGGKFYGEQVFDFLQMAHTVPLADASTRLPFNVDANGPHFKVKSTKLNLRSEPCVDSGAASNIKATLNHGHEMRALSNQAIGNNQFIQVETTVGREEVRGFVSFQLLESA
jgi:hypothetical protein